MAKSTMIHNTAYYNITRANICFCVSFSSAFFMSPDTAQAICNCVVLTINPNPQQSNDIIPWKVRGRQSRATRSLRKEFEESSPYLLPITLSLLEMVQLKGTSQGFNQKNGSDYDETLSPVVRLEP